MMYSRRYWGPVLTCLRNAQVYASAAEQGISVFDMRPSLVTQDLEQWMPLLDWILETTIIQK